MLPMVYSIKPATIEQKPIIFALIQPFLDELSRFPDDEPDYQDKNGIYHYPYLDHYWRERERFPYLLCNDSEIAGFALVRGAGRHLEMAEFYVMPQFRRRGLAFMCVTQIVRKHPGLWRISFSKYNNPSRQLWRKIALTLAKGESKDGELDRNHDYIQFSV